ncbi:hypothetical protein E4T45_05881, partial [Aureobasidium sp. EXF-8846]
MGSQPAVVPFVWVLTGFSCGIVIARSVMKIWRFRGMAWEDYLMFVSMTFAVVYGTSTTLLYNLHPGNFSQEKAVYGSPEFAKYLYISHAIGFMAPLFGRVSFCLYMLRVLSAASASRKYAVQVAVAVQVFVNAAITILVFTQCGSFENLWKHGIQTIAPSCIRHDALKVLALVAVTFNAITDLCLTILPAVVVWNIQILTKRARLGLAVTLGLSFFATIASISKIYHIYALYSFTSAMHIVGRLIVVMAVEINVVIVVASVPILAPLFLHNRHRNSIYKDPVLPTFEVRVESTSKRGLLQKSNLSGYSPSENTSAVRYDSGSGTTCSRMKVDEDFVNRTHGRPLQ